MKLSLPAPGWCAASARGARSAQRAMVQGAVSLVFEVHVRSQSDAELARGTCITLATRLMIRNSLRSLTGSVALGPPMCSEQN